MARAVFFDITEAEHQQPLVPWVRMFALGCRWQQAWEKLARFLLLNERTTAA